MADSDLIRLLKGEKPAAEYAFAELYNRYHLKIYNHCRFMLHDKVQAEDIYQMVWTRFFEVIKKGADIPNVPAYLYTIANNLYKNYVRDMKRNISLDEAANGYLAETIGNPDTPGVLYENAELMQILNTAINLLDEEYRQAFIMKKIEGMTYREIAEVEKITLECAKKRVIRAIEKIVKILQPYMKDFML